MKGCLSASMGQKAPTDPLPFATPSELMKRLTLELLT